MARPLAMLRRGAAFAYRFLFRAWKGYFATRIRYINARSIVRLNLGAGEQRIPGYLNIDVDVSADIMLDLRSSRLPFADNSVEAVVATSMINYLSAEEGQRLISEIARVLKPNCICRMSVQDIYLISSHYVSRNHDFFNETLPDGSDRYQGPTMGDKFVSWFYGHSSLGGSCRYAYDYEMLALRFELAGFGVVERRNGFDSRLDHIEMIDNRADQMFFLEAIK